MPTRLPRVSFPREETHTFGGSERGTLRVHFCLGLFDFQVGGFPELTPLGAAPVISPPARSPRRSSPAGLSAAAAAAERARL